MKKDGRHSDDTVARCDDDDSECHPRLVHAVSRSGSKGKTVDGEREQAAAFVNEERGCAGSSSSSSRSCL